MKKNLLICCFLFLQIISCSPGTIEAKPEATKLLIENKSKVQLLSVEWKDIDFGDIGTGKFSEKIVPNGDDYVRFKISSKRYRTFSPVACAKYKFEKFTFIDNLSVTDVDKPDSTIRLGDL